METKTDRTVREIQQQDIDLIADYWLGADSDFLRRMGVDSNKLPSRDELRDMLTLQISMPLPTKKSYALIWELNGVPVGHSNVNNIEFGKQATMHLHIWRPVNRKKGMGEELVKKSLPFYFDKLEIKKLICEPYALNPAPNRTLEKVGFEYRRTYMTIPGSLNFEQEVNRWELTEANFRRIQKQSDNSIL